MRSLHFCHSTVPRGNEHMGGDGCSPGPEYCPEKGRAVKQGRREQNGPGLDVELCVTWPKEQTW